MNQVFRLSVLVILFSLLMHSSFMHAAIEGSHLVISAVMQRRSQSLNESLLERIARSVKMSMIRHRGVHGGLIHSAARHANAFAEADVDSVVSTFSNGIYEYTMQVGIGTPTQTFNALLDTGSSLSWVFCDSSDGSSRQTLKSDDSETYHEVACDDERCPVHFCFSGGSCEFSMEYLAGASVFGDVARETFTLNATHDTTNQTTFPSILFGCARSLHNILPDGIDGVVGLDPGPESLVSQLGSSINHQFSYCLVEFDSPPDISNKIIFGKSAAFEGEGMHTTSFVATTPSKNSRPHYTLTLEAIGVGESRINTTIKPKSAEIVVDSGTTLTLLPPALHSQIVAEFKSLIKLPLLDYSDAGLNYCVDTSSQPSYVFPNLTLFFQDATILPPLNNYFIKVDDNNTSARCLAIEANEHAAVIGNIMQQNYHLLFDLTKSQISWLPTDCHSL